MVRIDDLASTALAADALKLRSLAMDWLSENQAIGECAPPDSSDQAIRAVAAALVEMFAERRNERPPLWTSEISAVAEPIYLLQAASTMRRLRALCESQSPAPLRKRNIFAPPTFLEFA
jgi:hypothetical protein